MLRVKVGNKVLNFGLIVIDMQNGFVSKGGSYDKLGMNTKSYISIIKTYDLVSKKKSLGWMIPVFAILVSIVAVAQYFVLGFVKNRIKSVVLGKRFHLNSISKMVTAFQYVLLLLLVMVVLQIVVLSYYKTIILVAITSISYTLTIGMMAMLATRFSSFISGGMMSKSQKIGDEDINAL